MKNSSRIYLIGNLLIAGLLSLMMISCKEEEVGQGSTDNEAPSAIKNVQVVPTPGGADITYDVPNESDISYVICEYQVNGETRVARSSVYSNTLSIVGLAEEEPCPFTLYLVDHSENRSAPFSGTFTPLEAPYKTVFKTLETEPDFGGITVRWTNATNAIIGVFLLAQNDSLEWEEYDLIFSSLTTDKRSIRGYNTDLRWFGVVLMDQYGNVSDTLKYQTEPLYEKLLDKTKFKDAHLQGDNTTSHNSRPIQNIWDGDYSTLWHTVPNAGFLPPQTFTIDLGVNAKLSRMVLYNRGESYYYGQHNPRYFKVWAAQTLSHDITDSYWLNSGDWRNEWTLLGDFEVVKPSGLPMGQNTDEDIAASDAGFDFVFESGVGEMRYVRFEITETWARTAALHIREIDLYGDDGTREE
jgi:hypothetical protein